MATEAERLALLYELNRRLATFTDLDELVGYATRRAREMFKADGCSLLLLDRSRRELHFPVASQREGYTSREPLSEIRFAAELGIAGWVLGRDEGIIVDDARNDPRFYAGVDERTRLVTRTVLCAPLRTRPGNIGVIEVINPAAHPSPQDLEFLQALAGDVGVAYEKAELYHALQNQAAELRWFCGGAGMISVALGVVLGVGAVLSQRARALPPGELFTHPALLEGLLALVVGLGLLGVGRGWLVRPTVREASRGRGGHGA